MRSALYTGTIRHRRYVDTPHSFKYQLFMCLLDVDQLPGVCDLERPWKWFVRFDRDDHLGHKEQSLSEAVRDLVLQETGFRPSGPVLLLTHLRYFGYRMNPLSVYYCLDASGGGIHALVLEVNNTPWNEQHCYVLDNREGSPHRVNAAFTKAFHVSPFLGMDYSYRCRAGAPGKNLVFHLENHREGRVDFDATLAMQRRTLNGGTLALALLHFPLMTMKVTAGIYYEAFRLWMKRAPYFRYMRTTTEVPLNE